MQKRGGGGGGGAGVEDVRCRVWAVLRILFCALGFGVVLGGALCFGLFYLFCCELRSASCFGVLKG